MTCIDCPTDDEIVDREWFEDEMKVMYPEWDALSAEEQDDRRKIWFNKTYVNWVLVE